MPAQNILLKRASTRLIPRCPLHPTRPQILTKLSSKIAWSAAVRLGLSSNISTFTAQRTHLPTPALVATTRPAIFAQVRDAREHAGRVVPVKQERQFSALGRTLKEHHFDTLRVVQRLRDEGFSEMQAEGIMKVMSEVIDESTRNLARTMVLKEEQEKITYTQKVDFAKLRSELHSQQNHEFTLTRNEYDRLTSELSRLNSRLREEITRAQNAFRLDLNLEKGRIREEASAHELKIKETDTRIEAEVGLLRGVLEGVKFSTLQWLIGVCTGTAALILGIWRLLM